MSEAPKLRGFAKMTAQERAAVSSRGGKAAHEGGKAHQFDSEAARKAGSKGGKASQQRRRERMQATPPKEEA